MIPATTILAPKQFLFKRDGLGNWEITSENQFAGEKILLIMPDVVLALFRLEMPAGMTARHVIVVGVISSIGFTVALFVSTAAFKDPSSPILDEVKMGAVFSFFGAVLAFIVARILRIRPLIEDEFTEVTATINEATVESEAPNGTT